METSNTNEQETPGFDRTTVQANTEDGMVSITAITHEYCKGLAVSMQSFGFFTVTHIDTGLKLCDHYERASSAILILSNFALIAKENNFSWAGLSMEEAREIMRNISSNPVPFDDATITTNSETVKQTIGEWMRGLRMMNFNGIVDEFPWEETDNHQIAIENLAKCRQATN